MEIKKELSLIEKINNKNISSEELRQALGFSIEDTIFVSNLPYNVLSNELKELFNQHGRVKSVRIPVDMAGKPKSIALITFSNEKEAMKTILKSDIIEIAGKKLKI